MKNSNELPPISRVCPWCQSNEGFSLVNFCQLTEPIGFRVECNSCYALGPIGETEESAINQWNNGFAVNTNKGFQSMIISKKGGNYDSP